MEEVRRNGDSLKRKHFAKLHERIQNKYDQMQRKLEKSKSVDSLSSLKEDYVYTDHRYASNTDLSMIIENIVVPLETPNLKHNAIIEEIDKNGTSIQYADIREASISESENTPCERNEHDNDKETNKFFGEDFYKISLESLNEVAKESDEYQTPTPTPPPTISIRNRIGSRISAAKDKRRQLEIEKNATKRTQTEKKRSREKVEKFILSNSIKQDKKIFKKTKMATVTIALIEATGLETEIPEEKHRLLFCRFRLGSEKHKSKAIKSHTSEVKFQELFNFSLYEDNIVEISLWDKDLCVGRSHIDLSEIEKERTHKMRIKLESEKGNVQIFLLLTMSGFPLVSLDDYQETQRRLATVRKKSPWYTLNDESSHVGSLTVIVYGAKGLSGNNCYCVLELDNERLQTHTEVKTIDPNWMKIFSFDVNDVTSILNITVFDEKRSEVVIVGCLSVPLLKIESNRKKWYALKDSNLRDRAKGHNPRILLEMELNWKLVKASIRVINPKEEKYLLSEDRLDRHLFSRNLARAKIVFNWTIDAFKVLKTCFEWESRKLNVIALTFWLLFCWFFKIWMLPLLLLVPFIWYRPPKYFLLRWKDYLLKGRPLQEEISKKEEKSSLRQKINSLQEMVQSVQNFLGEFANLGESIKNLFNFSVPFLSLLVIFIVLLITLVMFMVPTKYIFMIWGIHKFTRKILRPNRVPNNELLDILSRVPNDEVLLNCDELPLEEVRDEDVIK